MRAYIEAVALMHHDKETTLKVLQKYFKRDPGFLEEMYSIATRYIEKVPRVDPRNVATTLEFEPVKGVDAEALAAKVIDNSIVDKLAKEGFIEKVFAKR